jgi:hypothetical protein
VLPLRELCRVRRRHDPFLKLLYRAGARDAISLFFPDLAAHIDWEQIEWIDKEVPIPSRPPRSIIADLVGRTRDLDEQNLELLLHPELQMVLEDEMGWRVLQYNAGLTLQQANSNTRVLTFVFYHCAGAGGVQEQSYRLEFRTRSVLEVGYWSVGLGELDAQTYAVSANPMAWALTAWMRQPRRGRVELRLRLLEKILRLVSDEIYRKLLLDAVRSYFKLNKVEQAEEERLLQSQSYGEVNEMLNTELGRLEAKARREGRREGRLEGQRAALLELVQSRFSTVPSTLEAQIRRVQDVDQLNALIRHAARAATLEELEASIGR